MRIPLLAPDNYAFPDPAYALARCDGLVGVSRDLDAGRLLEAYRNGVFPWFSRDGWFFWYAVGPRAVIVPERLHVPRSLAKTLRNGSYRVAVNGCFAEVVAHCAAAARPNQDGTWIAPEFQTAYLKLHEMGHAHSFECHYPDENGKTRLAGGFYGVQIGRVFYGESIVCVATGCVENRVCLRRAVFGGFGRGTDRLPAGYGTYAPFRFGAAAVCGFCRTSADVERRAVERGNRAARSGVQGALMAAYASVRFKYSGL